MVRGLLWDGKVPGTSLGTGVAAAPCSEPAAGYLEENQINSSLPCQTGRIEWHQDGPGCLKSLGGIKEVADAQGQCSPAETVDAS